MQLHAVNADVAERADRPPFVVGPQALGAVFQYPDFALAGKGQDAVHVAGIALKVNGKDDLGLGRNLLLQVIWIQVKGLVDFGEHGKSTREHNRIEARVPGPSWENDFVTRPNLERSKGRRKGGGARSDRQREAGAHSFRKLSFESRYLQRRLRSWAVPAKRLAVVEHLLH